MAMPHPKQMITLTLWDVANISEYQDLLKSLEIISLWNIAMVYLTFARTVAST